MIESVRARTVSAELAGGGAIGIELLNEPANDYLRRHGACVSQDALPIVVALDEDGVGGSPDDTVVFCHDDETPLHTIERAIGALEAARAALVAVGHHDFVPSERSKRSA